MQSSDDIKQLDGMTRGGPVEPEQVAPPQKFDYRIVARASLAALEQGVLSMVSQGWLIQTGEGDMTLPQAFTIMKRGGLVTVSMKKAQT